MPAYQYDALKINSKTRQNGIINAPSEREAREMLRDQNLIPTQIALVNNGGGERSGKKIGFFAALIQSVMGVGTKDLITFTRNVGIMIRAGIPVTEALLYFENYCTNPKFKKTIASVRQDIMTGYAFNQALSKHKEIFGDVYINVTKAGERSGELDQTMGRLTELLTRSERLKMKVLSASMYPIIVVCILALVLIIMFVLVLPTFAKLYVDMNIKLPLITQIMLGISHVFRDYWFIAFPLMAVSVVMGIKFFKGDGKPLLDDVLMKVPVLGNLIQHTQSSHFVSTLFVAFGAGLPITDALYLASETVTHTQMRAAFKQVNVQIQTGQRLATALSKVGYVPDIVMLMVSTGEESGDLEKMLETAYDYLEEEINHRVEILTSMLEPVMLVVIGAVVGAVALSIYLPLFSIYEHL
jgi:type II secretory pathway component PulF